MTDDRSMWDAHPASFDEDRCGLRERSAPDTFDVRAGGWGIRSPTSGTCC
jgi:hypothetical protein